MKFDCELVGKVGSMALIRKDEYDIDYNVFSRLGKELFPGCIWVSSGAGEIGRIDYMKRNNSKEIENDCDEDIKSYYASQGQAILMENYRRFISQNYSVRQILVEHYHFNDPEKREFIRKLLLQSVKQSSIPIINYNDSVSSEEIRKLELYNLKLSQDKVVECIDNDETASQISLLVKSKYLVILTSEVGVLKNAKDPSTLISKVEGKNIYELIEHIREVQEYCSGTSRKGANGMRAKLEYLIEPVKQGTTVIIGHSKYRLSDLINGNVERTIFCVR